MREGDRFLAEQELTKSSRCCLFSGQVSSPFLMNSRFLVLFLNTQEYNAFSSSIPLMS
jgi:hypothetical protein